MLSGDTADEAKFVVVVGFSVNSTCQAFAKLALENKLYWDPSTEKQVKGGMFTGHNVVEGSTQTLKYVESYLSKSGNANKSVKNEDLRRIGEEHDLVEGVVFEVFTPKHVTSIVAAVTSFAGRKHIEDVTYVDDIHVPKEALGDLFEEKMAMDIFKVQCEGKEIATVAHGDGTWYYRKFFSKWVPKNLVWKIVSKETKANKLDIIRPVVCGFWSLAWRRNFVIFSSIMKDWFSETRSFRRWTRLLRRKRRRSRRLRRKSRLRKSRRTMKVNRKRRSLWRRPRTMRRPRRSRRLLRRSRRRSARRASKRRRVPIIGRDSKDFLMIQKNLLFVKYVNNLLLKYENKKYYEL